MKLVSWQTNLPECEIEVKSGQIQQAWVVLPTVASVSWNTGQAEHKYKQPPPLRHNELRQKFTSRFSQALSQVFVLKGFLVCLQPKGCLYFKLCQLTCVWLKYTYTEFKPDTVATHTYTCKWSLLLIHNDNDVIDVIKVSFLGLNGKKRSVWICLTKFCTFWIKERTGNVCLYLDNFKYS